MTETGHAPKRQPSILIIGAGPGGLCAAIRLRESGYTNIRILEKCAGPGGTWRINTYPGCECDIPSALYSFSFHLKPDWSKPYGPQPEILAYFEEIVARYALSPLISYNTEVRAARWVGAAGEWQVLTAGGENIVTDILVGALGQYNVLNTPDIEGLDGFAGVVFHSARWNVQHSLADASVAVIGSAASAVQLIPQTARQVRRLTVFQRTPNWVLPKINDEPYTAEQLERFRAQPELVRAQRDTIFSGLDGHMVLSDIYIEENERKGLEALEVIEDPDLRRRLTPSYRWGAKRPLFSDSFYQTFNQKHVRLVTEPIERVTRDGIITADGAAHEVDTIILATGFKADLFIAAIDITGRDGVSIHDAWREGAEAYLGCAVAGFPNLFLLYGPNTNNGTILFQIEQQAAYLVKQVDSLVERDLAWIDIKREYQDAFNRELQEALSRIVIYKTPVNGYFRAASGRIVTQWPYSHSEYARRFAADRLEYYEVEPLRKSGADGRIE